MVAHIKQTLLVITTLLFPLVSMADWSTDSATNDITVAHSSDNRYLAPITDGSGGMITAWRDNRNFATTDYDIYMQRLGGDGTVQWASDGIVLVEETGAQTYPYVLQLAGGGALIFWVDYRSGSADIYAQSVDIDGTKQWTSSGVAVASGSGSQQYYGDGYWFEDFILEDGSGGAFVTYYDDSDGDRDVYAQHINSSGSLLWGSSGTKVTNNSNNDQHARIVTDGSGGVIVIWENYNTGTGAGAIYGQQVNSSGVVQWSPSDGVDLVPSPAYPYKPADPEVVSDGSGGAIFLFNTRGGLSTGDLYMQRVDGSGSIQWGSSGYVMSNESSTEVYYDITPDGSGGFYAMWSDQRSGNYDVYTQKIDVDGSKQWTSSGVLVHPGSTSNSQITGDMLVDGSGNLIIAYRDDANIGTTGRDIAAQKLDSDGNLLWGTSGKVICNATGDQWEPKLVPTYVTSSEGYIAVWEDQRNSNYDLFASFVNIDGLLGGPGASAPLPVELISFDAVPAGDYVQLFWETAWEVDNDYFQIESSRDGINFETLGRIQGHGTTSEEQRYEYNDYGAAYGMNYYRLKQVDFDGSFEYSRILPVNFVLSISVSTYPNPATDHFRVRVPHEAARLELYNSLGQNTQLSPVSKNGEYFFDTRRLDKGLYVLKVYALNAEQSLKVIIE